MYRKLQALSSKAYFYRAQEFDHPHVLLQKETGHLKSMVQETGKAMAEALAGVARDCFQNRAFTALWYIIDVIFSQLRPIDIVMVAAKVPSVRLFLRQILGIWKIKGKMELHDEILSENLELIIGFILSDLFLSLLSTFYLHGNSILSL